MHDVQALLRNIKQRLKSEPGAVFAFWLKVTKERRMFAQELLASRGSTPIAPLVVRGTLFQNANALLDDLAELISQNRPAFDALPKGENGIVEGCAILLLAHNEFGLPQVSSPANFPEWFPLVGGREVNISIEDLTWKVEAPLDEAALRIKELSTALVRLERALLDRTEHVRTKDHNSVNAFFDLIRREKERFADFLGNARTDLVGIQAENFRPSAKAARSLTARIWILVRTSTPDQLHGRAEALARALALPDEQYLAHESLLTVLGRPTHRDGIPNSVRIARNILSSVFAACQILTAVHHPQDYAEYPLALMRTVGFDLVKALATTAEAVALLTADPPGVASA